MLAALILFFTLFFAAPAAAMADPCAGASRWTRDRCLVQAAQIGPDCARIGGGGARLACWDRLHRLANCPQPAGDLDGLRCRTAPLGPLRDVVLTSARASWQVEDSASAFGDARNVFLSVASDGPTTCGPRGRASLILRCLDDRTAAYVIHDCSTPRIGDDGWAADLRIGDDPVTRARMTPTADGTGFGHFDYQSARTLIEDLLDHDSLHLRFADIEGQSSELRFPVAGLAQALPALRQACGWSPVAPWNRTAAPPPP